MKMSKTPHIIWQTWKSKTNIPDDFKNYQKAWKKLHPNYEHILLDDADLRDAVKKIVPEYLEDYDSFTQNIERVDFARYAILYGYGGIYADMDTLPLKPIDEWVNKNKVVLGCEPKEHAENLYKRDRVLCNALMISPPGEKYWKDLMKFIIDNYEKYYKPVFTTGPMAMTKLYESNPEIHKSIIITDPCVFYPLTGGIENNTQKISRECSLKDSYVMHIWKNSWVDKGWWNNPIMRSPRYWTYGLLILFIVMWIILFFKSRK